MKEELLLQKIKVYDPKTKRFEQKDISISDGFYQETDYKKNQKTIVMEGCYLVPGLIDMHTHVFTGKTTLGIDADRVGIRQGVTVVVDAGSTGIRDFSEFQKKIIEPSETEVKFFLNIARQGLCDGVSELADASDLMTLEELLNFKKSKGKDLVGLKVRMSASVVKECGLKPLIHARKLADKAALPIMVHIGNGPPDLSDILELLQKGDIVTHCFHGKKGGLCDSKKAFLQAVERGVHFDAGHGTASFSYQAMQQVLAMQDINYSISTDIYISNFEQPVGSLMQTMTKFLHAGVPLEQIIDKVTDLPRTVLGLPLERIWPGETANGTIFRVVPNDKKLPLVDSEGVDIPADQRIDPVMTMKNGRRVWEKYV